MLQIAWPKDVQCSWFWIVNKAVSSCTCVRLCHRNIAYSWYSVISYKLFLIQSGQGHHQHKQGKKRKKKVEDQFQSELFLNTDLAGIRWALILTSVSALWDVSLYCTGVSVHYVLNWIVGSVGCYNIIFCKYIRFEWSAVFDSVLPQSMLNAIFKIDR